MNRIRGIEHMKMVKVNYRGIETKEFLEDTSLLEISDSFKKYYNYPILVAKVDNDITGLAEPVTKKSDIDFYDRSSVIGNTIYARSAQFILIVAVKQVLGEGAEVIIEHSIDKGVYCEIKNCDIDKPVLRKIESKMHEIVAEDLKFTKVSVSRIDAIKYFRKKKRMDKVNVLKYISNTYVNLYRLDDVYDYFYGELAYSTKAIDDFKLTYIKDNGFVLSCPDIYNPECTLDYKHHKMLFDTFLDYTKWGRILKISNAADLNEVVSTGKYGDLIRISEAYYNGQLSEIADRVYDNKKNIKIILIAGPSSSGKTTTSKKLEIYLKSKGLRTHQISIDDYFINRDKTPLDEHGERDLESLRAVDIDLLNRHLIKLFDGEKVLLPEYNFMTGEREYRKKWLQMDEDDIIIIEGLHALNEDLTISIPRRNKFKIYISPLTQLNIDNHNHIHTSDTRKLRRIIRDNKFRNYNAADTLKMWEKISYGEERYIFPFQDDADMIINSALVYELGVLKTYAEPLLFSVSENDPVYPEALRLINFLRNFLPIPSEEVPDDSVLREFIGNSCFYE
ncbi:MAG TPA: nucleoside kinase [Candidatus Fimihabitans intestinipullorum]|uniref:Nucleoside kinase n=1 Tax=Candidatus Fimihabitans intestinipullorum TaxID=2840820 RepID=A0A9D1L2B8_9BACT|nr:nucleoside kinase [Candidatus Fimihabitans intestinipullorum]